MLYLIIKTEFMRSIIIVLLHIPFVSPLLAQNSIEDILEQGIKYHDQGNYDKAIEVYKTALEIDPKSPVVNYEIALSYFKKGDYKKTIEYSDAVLDQKDGYMREAYLTKGSAMDLLGKTEESIKLFKKAIKKTGEHYLLYYNMAFNYLKLNDLESAEDNVIKAIENNSNHATSHLMLAQIHNYKKNPVQTLLAAHYFLFLEPSSDRSQSAYQILLENFGGNVTKDEEKPNTINISLSVGNDDEFSSVKFMIGLLEASKSSEENKDKTDDEMFVENTDSFFTMMGELNENGDKGKTLWWTFYTPFFYDLAKSEHMEAYCKYISQSGNESSQQWLSDNGDKLDALDSWLQEN